MSDNNHDIWETFKGVSKACDEVYGCKNYKKCNVNMWLSNSVVKDEIQKKKHIEK